MSPPQGRAHQWKLFCNSREQLGPFHNTRHLARGFLKIRGNGDGNYA